MCFFDCLWTVFLSSLFTVFVNCLLTVFKLSIIGLYRILIWPNIRPPDIQPILPDTGYPAWPDTDSKWKDSEKKFALSKFASFVQQFYQISGRISGYPASRISGQIPDIKNAGYPAGYLVQPLSINCHLFASGMREKRKQNSWAKMHEMPGQAGLYKVPYKLIFFPNPIFWSWFSISSPKFLSPSPFPHDLIYFPTP